MSISSIRKQTVSPLLRLPAELRNTIYSFVFNPVTIYVAFEPLTPIRQGLTLPQVCRQIQQDTKSLIDTYDTVHLNVGLECSWSAIDFSRLASDLRDTFSAVVTLQLSPTATEWLHTQRVVFLSDFGLASFMGLDPNPIPEIFKSLKRLSCLSVTENSISPASFQTLFGEPELVMVYA